MRRPLRVVWSLNGIDDSHNEFLSGPMQQEMKRK